MTDTNKNEARGPNRRVFLKVLTGAVGGAAVLNAAPALASPDFEGWPDSYGVLTDLTLCVGCRSCEQACAEHNKLPRPEKAYDDETVFAERRRPTEKVYTVVNQYKADNGTTVFRKFQCNHCKEPACATSCPIHAYSKTKEGAVAYDPDLCFGCRYCMTACPFYVPSYDYWTATDPKIVKCTMCQDRLAQGRPTACAEACPTGALTFGKREELIKLARKRISENKGKYVDHIYGEKEVGGTNWLYLSAVPFDQVGFPTHLPTHALIEETKPFLASVPVVLTVWPALFTMAYAALQKREAAPDKKEDRHG